MLYQNRFINSCTKNHAVRSVIPKCNFETLLIPAELYFAIGIPNTVELNRIMSVCCFPFFKYSHINRPFAKMFNSVIHSQN